MRTSPITDLLDRRMAALGLTDNTLLARLGYRNLAKGHRRLSALRSGDAAVADQMMSVLADALDVHPSVLNTVIEGTRAATQAEQDAAYRATFRPHAVFLTERSVPSQITICGMVNGDRLRVVTFDDDIQPDAFVQHVLDQLPEGLPFFGNVTGFAVNYTPDHATIHERDGRITHTLERAYQLGATRWWV
jgi:hypothetical protein